MQRYPGAGFEQADIDEYNAQSAAEYAAIRDFIILHYKATERTDSPFWDRVREMDIPDSLGQRIENLEESVGKRIDGLGTRVTNLEAEDKRLIEKTAKLSALGGGVGGALAAAAVELIKRM